ncbi:MAG: Acyl-protein synthetase, LuxE [Methanomassiliicoccales archaeon PtaU1.Bin124]|nr:MAG: Acyl-protein synthetase, LuxE [Methanomassiliicoccales archaeon PtaU1.Bin124]
MGFSNYINDFNRLTAKYVPLGNEWTPSEQAVCGVGDPFRVPVEQADALRFKAVKYQFIRHFEKNRIYRRYCRQSHIAPEDIRTMDDFHRIPLIPTDFFKDHPRGKDFALWLANLYTGDVPTIHIHGRNPSYDNVIDAFNTSGMAAMYSSGTGGRHTFVPRDMRSFNLNEIALSKNAISMFYPNWSPKMKGYLMLPNPFKTNLFAGRLATVFFDVMTKVDVAIDRTINTELIRRTMAKEKDLRAKLTRSLSSWTYRKTIDNIINWMEVNEKEGNEVAIVGAPYLLHSAIMKLKEDGRSFDFSGRGIVLTGGGWKVHEQRRMPETEFRKELQQTLGIEPDRCLDLYGMVEGNGWMTQCPEGHHLHIPTTYLHPMVLDEEYRPLGYGESGRFAFLDGSMYGYPGFVITGDRVTMLERCPHCGRPGPVLEPGVTRISGKDGRGCSDEVRSIISRDLRG